MEERQGHFFSAVADPAPLSVNEEMLRRITFFFSCIAVLVRDIVGQQLE